MRDLKIMTFLVWGLAAGILGTFGGALYTWNKEKKDLEARTIPASEVAVPAVSNP